MKFDNSENVIKIQMQKRLLAVLTAILVALVYTTDIGIYFHKVTGIPRYALTILFVGLYFSFYIYHIIAASSFVFYSDEEGKVIIRFYQLNLFNTSKNSYEIPKSEFMGFQIQKKGLGVREEVVVFRKFQGNIVRYPPFSINALTVKEKSNFLKSLSSYSKMDKS